MEVGERHVLFLTRERKENQGIADYYVNNCGNSSTLPKGDAVLKQVERTLREGDARAKGAASVAESRRAVESVARAAPAGTPLERMRERLIRAIERQLIHPKGSGGQRCVARKTQLGTGEIIEVNFGKCDSPDLLQAVEAALYRASPLPVPDDPSLFNANLELIFEVPQGR
jgi:colicin import membrane protein